MPLRNLREWWAIRLSVESALMVGSEVVEMMRGWRWLVLISLVASGEARAVISNFFCQYFIKFKKIRSPPLRLLPRLVWQIIKSFGKDMLCYYICRWIKL